MKIHWEPQAKQAIALASDADEILYGGARGGGKTDAGQAWLTYDIGHPLLRCLIIRRNAEDLTDWVDRAQRMYLPTGAVFTGKPAEINWPSGAKARTGHLKDENAYTKYQGHEYQRELIEELSHIPREKDYLKLIASCRSTVDGLKPQVFATTNPDDPGVEWIKERWGIPDVPDFDKVYTTYREVPMMDEEGRVTTMRRKLVFIPAKIEDNPILIKKDPGYVAFLESLKDVDPDLYEAWRKGNWKGYGTEGAYYRTQLAKMEADGRVLDIPYDEFLPVYTWCDLGIGDSFAIGYFQNYGKKWAMIDYDEFEGEGLKEVAKRMEEKDYFYKGHYAPHDIQARELGTGVSRLETAKTLGIDYNIVPKLSVEDGINAVRMKLSTLWVDKTKCDLWLKRMRRYHKEFDEKRGVYKNKPVHDINSHAADMTRGWATTPFSEEDETRQYRPSWISRKSTI